MKVYIAMWCNNEEWEDYNDGIEAVFATHEAAEPYIISKGYKKHKWLASEEEYGKLPTIYDEEPNEYGEYYSLWIEEWEVRE